MKSLRVKPHKSNWRQITVIGEILQTYNLDENGCLIQKFPKKKPRKGLYQNLNLKNNTSSNDQVIYTASTILNNQAISTINATSNDQNAYSIKTTPNDQSIHEKNQEECSSSTESDDSNGTESFFSGMLLDQEDEFNFLDFDIAKKDESDSIFDFNFVFNSMYFNL